MMIVLEILIIIIYNNRFREILNNSERKYGIRDSKCVVEKLKTNNITKIRTSKQEINGSIIHKHIKKFRRFTFKQFPRYKNPIKKQCKK